jgi:phosphoglycerate dehydrogenase-like enzyme
VLRSLSTNGNSIIVRPVLRCRRGFNYERDACLTSCEGINPRLRQALRELKLMKRGALLINTARGELVNQKALAQALEEGHLAGAAVDTLSPEPPPQDHPLLSLSPAAKDRLLMIPHIGGITRGALRRVFNTSFENILRVAAGEPPRNVVNGALQVRIPPE